MGELARTTPMTSARMCRKRGRNRCRTTIVAKSPSNNATKFRPKNAEQSQINSALRYLTKTVRMFLNKSARLCTKKSQKESVNPYLSKFAMMGPLMGEQQVLRDRTVVV